MQDRHYLNMMLEAQEMNDDLKIGLKNGFQRKQNNMAGKNLSSVF